MYDFHNFALTPEQDLVVNIVILSSLVFAILKGEKKIQHSNPLMILAFSIDNISLMSSTTAFVADADSAIQGTFNKLFLILESFT